MNPRESALVISLFHDPALFVRKPFRTLDLEPVTSYGIAEFMKTTIAEQKVVQKNILLRSDVDPGSDTTPLKQAVSYIPNKPSGVAYTDPVSVKIHEVVKRLETTAQSAVDSFWSKDVSLVDEIDESTISHDQRKLTSMYVTLDYAHRIRIQCLNTGLLPSQDDMIKLDEIHAELFANKASFKINEQIILSELITATIRGVFINHDRNNSNIQSVLDWFGKTKKVIAANVGKLEEKAKVDLNSISECDVINIDLGLLCL